MAKPASLILVLACLGWTMPAAAATVDLRVNASADDADETNTGAVSLTAESLKLGQRQWIGLRFTGVTIPQGAYITSAYVTFRAKDSDSTATSVTVFGENVDSSAAFTTTASNLGSRARTTASASWASMPGWTEDNAYSTPELKTVVQEIVNRPAWASGNSLSILVRSDNLSGNRRAKSYDGSTTRCPLLHVDYAIITRPVATRLLFVVTNSATPMAGETARRDAFRAWGYTVTLLSATASQAAFDTSAAANDVAYISEAVTSTDVNMKLKGQSLGIVNANTGLADDLAVASVTSTTGGTAINIDSNAHYLTSPWPAGSLTIAASSQTLMTVSGTLALQHKSVASIAGAKSLVAVEIGGTLNDATKAAGRRVQLPWGDGSFDFNSLSPDGYNLLSRALAWAGGVVGYWKLDETTGDTASDSSVNLHAGSLANFSFTTNRVASAMVDGGLAFDGSSGFISAPNTTDLQLTKAMSMSAWIRGNSWGSGSTVNIILRKGENNPNNYQLAIENGYVALGLDGNDGSNAHGNTLLQTGTWYHVAATWDGSTIKIYVNGVLDNTPAARAAPVGTDTRALYLGGRSGTDYFNGVLDDVRLYNHALDADEITVLKTLGQAKGVRIIKWLETL